MRPPADLLACPLCRGELGRGFACRACGALYAEDDGVARLRLAGEARTEVVRQFYERAPFPG